MDKDIKKLDNKSDKIYFRILERLQLLSGKKKVFLVSRGNSAIFKALLIAKSLGKTKVIIPDQGGWLTYKTFPKILDMEVVEFRTDDGFFEQSHLDTIVGKDSVLLISSLAGYFAKIDIDSISQLCKKHRCMLVDDVSGSIGMSRSSADIVVCSFGKWKPIDLGFGGFIGVDDAFVQELSKLKFDRFTMDNEFNDTLLVALDKKLKDLDNRLDYLWRLSDKVRKDLNNKYEIVHTDKKGLNVIVAFDSLETKNKIIEYCRQNEFNFTVCPRYIRVNRDAISIEIKQKTR